MNSKDIKSISYSDDLCFKCLQKYDKTDITTVYLLDCGYGSKFDGFNSKMQLCSKCYEECKDLWKMNSITDEKGNDLKRYESEEDIIKYINELPIEGQELFLNRMAWGTFISSMGAQDWIDYKLGELPYEKCKEYGLISYEELSDYKEKFPKCKYPINITNDDGSQICHCPRGSYGKYGQEVDDTLYINCYNCPIYTERTEDDTILDLSSEEAKVYKLYVLYEANKEKIEEILKRKKDE